MAAAGAMNAPSNGNDNDNNDGKESEDEEETGTRGHISGGEHTRLDWRLKNC